MVIHDRYVVIHGYMWLHMVMGDYTWLWVVIHGYNYVIVFGLHSYVIIHDYICGYACLVLLT